uniref:Uncharacterized protein n=1 Tax=Ackermannviridae sp. TaxID=2831612 RepID=A0A8S5VKD7_9CAUD|nr:MAG TPA: hypothetical protein [Ackermannviridae sp.]
MNCKNNNFLKAAYFVGLAFALPVKLCFYYN